MLLHMVLFRRQHWLAMERATRAPAPKASLLELADGPSTSMNDVVKPARRTERQR
jgi:hypothetical protein